MVHNRMYLRCRGCGAEIMLGNCFSLGWYIPIPENHKKGEQLQEFLEKHSHCCEELEEDTCGGVSPFDSFHFEPTDGGNDRQDYYDRRESESGEVIKQIVKTLLVCLAFAMLGSLLTGCTTTRYVPVTETHTEHHWHTDSVKERDSTHTERETIIREVDSAAMARYGIQMQANQRAWLVLQREMENRLRELEHMSAQRDTVHDSIPVPYPVIKEVPASLTWWQQARLHLANIMLYLLAIVAIFYVGKKLLRKVNPMP